MSMCPYCGLPPTATSGDAEEAVYECEAGHTWQDVGSDGDEGNGS